jgi:hypothetical protein
MAKADREISHGNLVASTNTLGDGWGHLLANDSSFGTDASMSRLIEMTERLVRESQSARRKFRSLFDAIEVNVLTDKAKVGTVSIWIALAMAIKDRHAVVDWFRESVRRHGATFMRKFDDRRLREMLLEAGEWELCGVSLSKPAWKLGVLYQASSRVHNNMDVRAPHVRYAERQVLDLIRERAVNDYVACLSAGRLEEANALVKCLFANDPGAETVFVTVEMALRADQVLPIHRQWISEQMSTAGDVERAKNIAREVDAQLDGESQNNG